MDYTVIIKKLPTRANRMITGGYEAEITHPDGTKRLSPRLADAETARKWSDEYIAAHQEGRIVKAPKIVTPDAAQSTVPPTRDRAADHVAHMIGLPPARNDGRCHYCGLPLNRRGYCEECV